MKIPDNYNIPTNKLSAVFNNTSATYKYYWFLSIIHAVENGMSTIPKRVLFAKMISNAWYTVNYFHISFGKQDLIQDAVRSLLSIEKLSIEENQQSVFQKLTVSKNLYTEKLLLHFDKNVPHWFLSPWFPKKEKNEIYRLSKLFDQDCLYALNQESIVVNPNWLDYLTINSKVLKDFCYWNLTLFLQNKNPNVPDISNKLIKPAQRNSLLNQRKHFWDIVIDELGSVQCIYTGKDLTLGDYAVEHFVPYNFVSHDLIWNLIPADKSFNSFKSDKLPSMDKHFIPFFKLQKNAFEIITHKNPRNRFLEDYITIFHDISNFSEEKFKETIQPLITIASNNGFEHMP